MWRAEDLAPLQTLATGGGWVTDVAYVEGPAGWGRKLVVASQDRTVRGRLGGWVGQPAMAGQGGRQARPLAVPSCTRPPPPSSPHLPQNRPPTRPPNPQLSFFDPARGGFDPAGSLACTGALGPPQCLAELERPAGQAGAAPRLVWGDTGEGGRLSGWGCAQSASPRLRGRAQLA